MLWRFSYSASQLQTLLEKEVSYYYLISGKVKFWIKSKNVSK